MKAKTKTLYRILQAHFTILTLAAVLGLSVPVAAALSVARAQLSADAAQQRAQQEQADTLVAQHRAKKQAAKDEAAKQAQAVAAQAEAARQQIAAEQAKAAEAAAQTAATQAAVAAAPKLVVSAPVASKAVTSRSLYVDPYHLSLGRPAAITSQPIARWFGDWNSDITGEVAEYVNGAAASGQLGVIVAYNIPARDCGGYSAGGVGSYEAYRTWIRGLAAGIGQHQVMVVLEPDALAGMDCLNSTDQQQRLANLSDAVAVLSGTGALTYIDAGNAVWQSVGTMASRLQQANVAAAQGFSLNVSNFIATSPSASYGAAVAAAIGGKHFIIDTSRNGNGPAPGYAWCNPAGRALGIRPTTSVSEPYLDAYLWIKFPGESDGTCNGGPAAGEWFAGHAQELISNAGY